MAISVFLSTVSDEFRSYRDLLVHDLTRHNVAVKVQEDFNDSAAICSISLTPTSPIATRSCISWALCAAPRRALSDHDRLADACDLSRSPCNAGSSRKHPASTRHPIPVLQGPLCLASQECYLRQRYWRRNVPSPRTSAASTAFMSIHYSG